MTMIIDRRTLAPRSVGFNPLAAKWNPLWGVDFSDTSKLTLGVGPQITAAEDQLGTDFEKAGSGTISTGTKNGLNTADFPAGDVYLASATNITIAAPFSLACVAKNDLGVAFEIMMSSTGTDWFNLGTRGSNDTFEFRTFVDNNIEVVNFSPDDRNWNVLIATYETDGTMRLYVNGVEAGSSASNSGWDSEATTVRIGTGNNSGHSHNGPMGEGWGWNSIITVAAANTYFTNRWGI